jgi:hypothetical protein
MRQLPSPVIEHQPKWSVSPKGLTVCLGNQLLVAVIFGVLLLIEGQHKEANG